MSASLRPVSWPDAASSAVAGGESPEPAEPGDEPEAGAGVPESSLWLPTVGAVLVVPELVSAAGTGDGVATGVGSTVGGAVILGASTSSAAGGGASGA